MSDPCHSSARAVFKRSGTVRHSQGKHQGTQKRQDTAGQTEKENEPGTTEDGKTPERGNPKSPTT